MTRRPLLSTLPAAVGLAVVLTACSTGPAPSGGAADAASSTSAATPPPSASTTTTPTTAAPPPPTADSGRSSTVAAATPTGSPALIASNLDAPWSVAFVGDTALVSERDTGAVLEVLVDGTTRQVGVVDGVDHNGEGGLLGLTADGDERLFVYSTGNDGNRIQRFDLEGTAGSFSLGPVVTLLDGVPAASYHNGGRLAFGPDGMLYAGVGDAGNPDASQDLESPSGKILRMTPDGAVPADNPFPGSLVLSYGHRNVQGFGWAADGTMFATEFGQNTWDELNVIRPGGNYGWPEVEGQGGGPEFIDPVQQWEPSDASPSGMTVSGGTVFIANLRGRVLRTVPVADPGTSTEWFAGTEGRLRDVVTAPDGRLWMLTGNTDGRGSPGADDDRLLAVELTG